jgi:hypothetical protein
LACFSILDCHWLPSIRMSSNLYPKPFAGWGDRDDSPALVYRRLRGKPAGHAGADGAPFAARAALPPAEGTRAEAAQPGACPLAAAAVQLYKLLASAQHSGPQWTATSSVDSYLVLFRCQNAREPQSIGALSLARDNSRCGVRSGELAPGPHRVPAGGGPVRHRPRLVPSSSRAQLIERCHLPAPPMAYRAGALTRLLTPDPPSLPAGCRSWTAARTEAASGSSRASARCSSSTRRRAGVRWSQRCSTESPRCVAPWSLTADPETP